MTANIKGFKHKNYSRARIDRENKVAVGNEIFDVREDLEHFKVVGWQTNQALHEIFSSLAQRRLPAGIGQEPTGTNAN